MHDQKMEAPGSMPGSKKRLEALLKKKSEPSKTQSQRGPLGPIESALKNHPGLTREKAEEMAEQFTAPELHVRQLDS
jgi:hypothetical protein